MDNDEVLIKIMEEYPDSIGNAKQFKALLSDFFPGEKLKKNMFGIFAETNIIKEISEKKFVTTIDFQRYGKIIENDYGFNNDQIKPYLEDIVSALEELGFVEDYEWDWFCNPETIQQFNETIDKMKALNERISNLETNSYNTDDEEDEVEQEYFSISHLFREKDSKLLLVVKSNWTNDYCMSVDYIESGWAYGTCYRNGKEYKEDRQGARAEEFRLYDGPSRALIEKAHIPLKNNVSKDMSLKEFWISRGFEVIDERNLKRNGYLFVKGTEEQLEPYVKIVREKFGVNGHFQPCRVFGYEPGWGTISGK